MTILKQIIRRIGTFSLLLFLCIQANSQSPRTITNFNNNWKFYLGDDSLAKNTDYNDSKWRILNLPHDWSIEGTFSKDAPATTAGGALPTGIGWYRKTFSFSVSKNTNVYIDFDGVYRNSEVWINGNFLGKRPYGYSSFCYDLTPFLKTGTNVIAVRVDNSGQPNSRWYTGSGIYRNVRLVSTGEIHVDHWGEYITTTVISKEKAQVNLGIKLKNTAEKATVSVKSVVFDSSGKEVAHADSESITFNEPSVDIFQQLNVSNPQLWSVEQPYLYSVATTVYKNSKPVDVYSTHFGIRSFYFDSQKGFFLNGKPLKILGVCNHHDLGALGATVNKRAIEHQLEILKDMGCNAIRTAHNPPAPELLDLCDRMGFLVMDEAFDMWKKKKNKQDYAQNFKQWHATDLKDMVLRDRNHPSVFMWSIGNEIREQFDSTGIGITRELAGIVRSLDTTRPVTCALTENDPSKNFIWQSGALDVLGFNYKEDAYSDLPNRFPGQKFIATETNSVLASRGHYDMPSDSIRLWPADSKNPFTGGNPDNTVSAYDHVMAYWGSTHEKTWNLIKKLDHMAGMFIWSGFDFIGEPVPYPWPARSSYYGIIDLCGFPKDSYYLYKSEWTNTPVLHLFPHWNWKPGQMVDVWAYYNKADEVELFLNGKSLGTRRKEGDQLHVMWRVKYEPGTLHVISRKNGKTVLEKEIKTAGMPSKIRLTADRNKINPDGTDLSFVTVEILDKSGNLVPGASNLVNFSIQGEGFIAGVDNGYQAGMDPFKAESCRTFRGKCLVIIRASANQGEIKLKAISKGLESGEILIKVKQ